MLNLNCVICTELFSHTDEVHVTICGHMFHNNCLKQWITRSKTCPQCRNKCTERHIWRVYFNLANLDISHIDVGSIQEQLDNANLAMKLKERECNQFQSQILELKNTQKKCLKTISGLEDKLQKKDFLISNYVQQIEVLKCDANVVDGLRKEIKSLKQEVHTMESVSAIMAASATETEGLLKIENNPKVLCTWVSTLKRELRQCEAKKTDLRNVLKVSQADLRKELEIKRKLEERNSQLESDLYQALQKLQAKESSMETDSFSSTIGLNNNILSLKLDERRNTISPTVKENVKRIEESNSPYFNIKSSSAGLAPLLRNTGFHNNNKKFDDNLSPIKKGNGVTMVHGAIRKTNSDLSEKYSIFKKPRLALGAVGRSASITTVKTLSSNVAYNGFGGSEKIDPFIEQDEEEDVPTTSNFSSKNINERLKAGSLRNFQKLAKE